ncbi:hypothetical protein QQ045_023018 [Rhodiola kirilowii]
MVNKEMKKQAGGERKEEATHVVVHNQVKKIKQQESEKSVNRNEMRRVSFRQDVVGGRRISPSPLGRQLVHHRAVSVGDF